MVRISKDPEIRREELIEAAGRLFEEKGFENTAVSDIVKAVGVAQGTFYYHFKSKDEILVAVGDKIAEMMIGIVLHIMREDQDDPIKQINQIFRGFAKFQKEREKTVELMHDHANTEIHDRIAEQVVQRMVPLFADIVRHGKELGIFKVTHVIETVQLFFGGLGFIGHQHGGEITREMMERSLEAGSEFMDRVLGAPSGSFDLKDIFG
jgi:AcrR family transcriptional regulator